MYASYVVFAQTRHLPWVYFFSTAASDALTEGHPLLKYCSLKYAPATGKEDEETFSGKLRDSCTPPWRY